MSHDFVGCVRSFVINGQDKLKELPLDSHGITDTCPRTSSEDVCLGWSCKNGGVCISKWEEPVCRCPVQYSGENCEKGRHKVCKYHHERKPFKKSNQIKAHTFSHEHTQQSKAKQKDGKVEP